MATISSKDIRQAVREHYGEVAQSGSSCCAPSCCSPETKKETAADDAAKALGYTAEEITAVPEGSNLGLGCGNPQAIASLKAGETCWILGAAQASTPFWQPARSETRGFVIGVDMTPDMVAKARGNAEKGGFQNWSSGWEKLSICQWLITRWT